MKREYFYTEARVVRPYHYCSECGKQFNDDEFLAGQIVNVGSGITPIKYCAKPCLSLKFPNGLSKTGPFEIEEKIILKKLKK